MGHRINKVSMCRKVISLTMGGGGSLTPDPSLLVTPPGDN